MARKDRADSSSSSDDEEGRSISRKKISPSSGTSTDDRFWGLLKKLMVISGIAALFLNIHATRKLSEQFASDYEADLAEFTKPLVITIPEPIDPLGSSTQAAAAAAAGATSRARPPNKVLKILQMLDRQEKAMRPPEGLRRVVVLGKSFILKRDYSIWEMTFGDLGFQVTATNKQELAHEGPDGWSVMLCLDLFDGKSHCMEPSDLPSMRRWQKISRLIGLRKILWNKDKFCETMGASLKGFRNYTEFVFPCWILPHQFNDMITEVKERFQDTRFILKPTDRGEGNGIIVMDSYRKLADWKSEFPDNEEVVVQTYLNDPMLIKERKWDMRTYILITSIHPLRIYMYRDGLVRFASTKYDKDAKDGGKKTAFLTNTSVNKKTGQSVEDLTWPYPQVYEYLKKHDNIDPDVLWKRIERAVTQVIMSSESAFLKKFKTLRNDYTCANCYQLLGVDVIVDAKIVPRIIEVNGEPSMQLSGEVNSHYDHTKKSMTHDLVKILFTTESYANELTALLYELELDGWNIGYMGMGGCSTSDDICLRSIDLQYLLDFVKEDHNMGGFRRLYPTAEGEIYTRYLQHLESKLPYGTLTSTLRLHKLATTLARRSRVIHNNAIEDESYKTRTGGLSNPEAAEDSD
jgi:hypothetical protein